MTNSPCPAELLADLRTGLSAFSHGPGDLPALPGIYALAISLPDALDLPVTSLSRPKLAPGWYIYAGSARGPGGLRARLTRHLRRGKQCHWHVDHLTERADEMWVMWQTEGRECDIVAALKQIPNFHVPLPGFGASDCRSCQSHLLAWRH